MTQSELVKQLDVLLSDKKAMYNIGKFKCCYEHNTKEPGGCVCLTDHSSNIDKIVCQLDKNGYQFTQDQFDKFIVQLLYKKSKGYLTQLVRCYCLHENVLEAFFKQHTPSQSQLLDLFDVYKNADMNYAKCFKTGWARCLIEKGYKFTKEQITVLTNLGCNVLQSEHCDNIIYDTERYFLLIRKSKKEDYQKLFDICKNGDFIPDVRTFREIIDKFEDDEFYLLVNLFFEKGLTLDTGAFSIISDKWEFIKETLNYYDRYAELSIKDTEYYLMYAVALDCKINSKYMNMILRVTPRHRAKCPPIITELYGNQLDRYTIGKGLNILLQKGYVPTCTTLNLIFEHLDSKIGSTALYKMCVEKYGIQPNNITLLKASLSTASIEVLDHILGYKTIKPNYNNLMFIMLNRFIDNEEAQKLFARNGLKITYDQLVEIQYATRQPILLKLFGLNYDEELYFACFRANHYIASYIFELSKSLGPIIGLRNMFAKISEKKQFKEIVEYMKKNNVKMDQYCLALLFKYKCTSGGRTDMNISKKNRYARFIDNVMDIIKCPVNIFCFTDGDYTKWEYLKQLYPDQTKWQFMCQSIHLSDEQLDELVSMANNKKEE